MDGPMFLNVMLRQNPPSQTGTGDLSQRRRPAPAQIETSKKVPAAVILRARSDRRIS
jgi:hypothetical protein